jgi:hypothetical protein
MAKIAGYQLSIENSLFQVDLRSPLFGLMKYHQMIHTQAAMVAQPHSHLGIKIPWELLKNPIGSTLYTFLELFIGMGYRYWHFLK